MHTDNLTFLFDCAAFIEFHFSNEEIKYLPKLIVQYINGQIDDEVQKSDKKADATEVPIDVATVMQDTSKPGNTKNTANDEEEDFDIEDDHEEAESQVEIVETANKEKEASSKGEVSIVPKLQF